MGIRNKLVLCLLAVLLPLGAVGVFATHMVDLQMAERTKAALANTQRLEAARIDQILEGYVTVAEALAAGPHVRDFVAKVHFYRDLDSPDSVDSPLIGGQDEFALVDPDATWPLQQLALALQRKAGIIGSSVVELRLIDRAGHIVGETLGFSWIPADDGLVERSMQTHTTLFGDAFLNIDDHQRLGMVSPITSHAGHVVGALVLETRLAPITDLISKHEIMGASAEAHIAQPTTQGDAQFITPLRFDRKAAFQKIVPAEKALPVNLALESPQSQVIKSLDYRGVESFLALQTIANTGWGLIVKVDTNETYAPVASLRSWLRWATAASIGFVALIYLFFLVPIVSRLNRAARAARQIRQGDLSARLIDNNHDEISELATSINSLARDLDADQKMRSKVESQLRHQAVHDDLTGLLNRKHANTVIQQLTKTPEKEHSMMFLDLNGFKDVNDLYGHAVGDEVLRCIAERLAAKIPQGATLARWGGDEFVVILPDTCEPAATDFALTLHKVFDAPVHSSEGQHNISCSIGLATSDKVTSIDQALLEADASMYEQKKCQRLQRSKGGMRTRGVERALLENRMEIWFQPMVRLERPGIYALFGADASMRMRNKQGGYVLPGEFMPELKDVSVSRELDRRTVDLALGALRRWNLAGIVDNQFCLSISLSQQTLDDPAFPMLLDSRLQNLNISPAQIQLVIPCERAHLTDSVLGELSRIGVPIALKEIDSEPKLLRQASTTRPSCAIFSEAWLEDESVLPHLVGTCQKLQIDVLASHVDNREQLAQLHALGITQFQGNLFEQPVTAVDFVSRWGQTRLTGLGKATTQATSLRLAG